MSRVAVLFVRTDSEYKDDPRCDCFDFERDAKTYQGSLPVIAHPPCRAWGVLSHMAKPRDGEKELAFFAVEQVRKNGGALEHPHGSRLWKEAGLPEEGEFPDEFGGYTIEIDQYSFGHVANKPTKIYIVGCPMEHLPEIPKKTGRAEKSITGQVPNTKRCTQKEREYTPELLREWLIKIAINSDRKRSTA